MPTKLCTWTAKTHAIPSLHRDSLAAKEPELCSVLTSGNTNALYCRVVISKPGYQSPVVKYLITRLIASNIILCKNS